MTISEAVTELVRLLDGVVGQFHPEIKKVYDHEPTQVQAPVSLTVSLGGVTPTDWLLTVRLYGSMAGDPKAMQATVNLAVPAIENTLTASYGRADWSAPEFLRNDDGIPVWMVLTVTLPVGREDF